MNTMELAVAVQTALFICKGHKHACIHLLRHCECPWQNSDAIGIGCPQSKIKTMSPSVVNLKQ